MISERSFGHESMQLFIIIIYNINLTQHHFSKTDTLKVTPKLSVSHNNCNTATVQIVRNYND